jgi:dTDP-4-dehydrorhamnose reductase
MSILIIGSTGMLGNTLKKYLTKINIDFKTLDRKDLDLSKCGFDIVKEKIIQSGCNVVVNCAGIVKQRKNTSTADFIHVNSLIPHWISDICEKQDMKMIHITTDCVFDGKIGDYKESDVHSVYDDYGRSKSMGEPKNCTVIRTSIIGEEEENKLSLLEWVKSNKGNEIDGYKNHLWNGLTCLQLSKLMKYIIDNDLYWNGVKHIFSNQVNKYDLVKMINEIYELDIKIHPTNGSTLVNRTLDTVYDIDIFNIPNLGKQIKETKDFHNNIKMRN